MLISDIRRKFLEYFRCHDHYIAPSASLVPAEDPSLLFNSAGMVPFKGCFTGAEEAKYTKVASAQKCVRAGGKHNDLENVGCTKRHHTFFEMLGNFSFGDYFKEEAIVLSWNLLTNEFCIPKERLIVTVYEEDDEAAAIWKKVAGIQDSKIIRIGDKDNFWTMGTKGPCGPCSEVFYDHGDDISGGVPGSGNEGDRYTEIWNLVFMQFYQQEDGTRDLLPKPSIDTGMGLERIGAVLQGKSDNYDTDLMRNLICDTASLNGYPPDGKYQVSLRIISDHIRAITFLISDGVLPSNEGRGYVLRRIMRRAMRHAHLMNPDKVVLSGLVSSVVDNMKDGYPEIEEAFPLVKRVVQSEEERFKVTLDRGLYILEEEVKRLSVGSVLSGELAFKLYDTYGFPLDLTQDILRERGMTVEIDSFDKKMLEQKSKSISFAFRGGDYNIKAICGKISSMSAPTEFTGYDTLSEDLSLVLMMLGYDTGEPVEEVLAGSRVIVVVDKTPFYADSGGQQHDIGIITLPRGGVGKVTDVKKLDNGIYVHLVEVISGSIARGERICMEVDSEYRQALCRHHTAVHILHEALHHVLGDHVSQCGSLVAADRLRFDFSHVSALTDSELYDVERMVNKVIMDNFSVSTSVMPLKDAKAMGARALFSEKYGDTVRVVKIENSSAGDRKVRASDSVTGSHIFSAELCGGTHVKRTGDIGIFTITHEGSSSSGIRRIEALTGLGAMEELYEYRRNILSLANMLKTDHTKVLGKVEDVLNDRRRVSDELASLKKKIALAEHENDTTGHFLRQYSLEDNRCIFIQILNDCTPGDLRGIIDEKKKALHSAVVILINISNNRSSIVCGVTGDMLTDISAVDVVRWLSGRLGGKGGGGRNDFAQSGGGAISLDDIPDIFEDIRDFIVA